MKTKIFYFSGTGNSLTVARDLAAELGDSEVINIAKVIDQDIKLDCDNVGLVFPVYIWGPPLIVTRFIKKLNPAAKYFFAVASYGGFPGGTFSIIKKAFTQQGIRLNAGFGVLMPGNYTPMYGAKPVAAQDKMFKKEKAKIKEIASSVRKNLSTKLPGNGFFINWLFTELLYKSAAGQIPMLAKDFWVTEKCDGCGICAKVCPTKNIALENKKPRWGQKCEQCLACLQWCPKEAIEYGKSTKNKKRYRHPAMTVKDFIL